MTPVSGSKIWFSPNSGQEDKWMAFYLLPCEEEDREGNQISCFFANRDILKKKPVCLCWVILSINVWSEISLNHTHGALLHNSKKEDKWGSLKLRLGFTTAQKSLKTHLTFTIRCPVCPWWLSNTSSENALNPRRKVVTRRPEAGQPEPQSKKTE